MMPDIDGFKVCKQLKNNPKTANIPVVFLSALTEDEEKRKGLDLGAVDFITKPFDSSDIKAKLKKHLLARQTRNTRCCIIANSKFIDNFQPVLYSADMINK